MTIKMRMRMIMMLMQMTIDVIAIAIDDVGYEYLDMLCRGSGLARGIRLNTAFEIKLTHLIRSRKSGAG